ncbi:EamA-like transporter family-domain-containing protein [Cyathus striatus]|nr:EamA-like transporter family-domain-containing protein [Cyathus striatus]
MNSGASYMPLPHNLDYEEHGVPQSSLELIASSPTIGRLHESFERETPRPTALLMYWQDSVEMLKQLWMKNTGVLFVIASQGFFTLMNVGVKKLNSIDPPVPSLELIAVRMGVTYIASLAYMLYKGIKDPFLGPKGIRILLALRGVGGFFGLFGVYYSLEFLSLSDTTVLTYLAPMCVAFSGAFFLGESFTKKQAIASVFSVFGIILIARPPFLFEETGTAETQSGAGSRSNTIEKGTPAQRLIANISLGVAGTTVAFTSIAAIGKRAHPLHLMLSFSLQCVVVSVVLMFMIHAPIVLPTELLWISLLLFLGISGFVAQILLTMGLQRETAGRGAMAVYSQVVFAAASELLFFHATPSVLSILGNIIIVCSAISVALMSKKVAEPSVAIRLRQMSEGSLEEGLLSRASEAEKDIATLVSGGEAKEAKGR